METVFALNALTLIEQMATFGHLKKYSLSDTTLLLLGTDAPRLFFPCVQFDPLTADQLSSRSLLLRHCNDALIVSAGCRQV